MVEFLVGVAVSGWAVAVFANVRISKLQVRHDDLSDLVIHLNAVLLTLTDRQIATKNWIDEHNKDHRRNE